MVNPKTSHSSDTSIKLDKELLDKSTIRTNLTQDILVITIDRLKLCMIEHRDILMSRHDWKTPAGIFLTLVTSLFAAEFKTFLGIDGDIWKAIFIILAIVTFVWLGVTLFKVLIYFKRGGIDKLIEKLHESSSTNENIC